MTHTTPDGFITEQNTELMGFVARLVNMSEVTDDATVEHTGGGIFCINVSLSDGRFMYWGTADGVWGADLNDADGDFIDSISTELQELEATPEAVADAIISAVKRLNTE